MNGYSHLAKNEISALSTTASCCKRAFLSALVRLGGSLVFSRGGMKIVLPNLSDKLSGKVTELFGELFDGVSAEKEGADTVIGGAGLTGALFALGIFVKNGEGETAIEDGIVKAVIASDCCAVWYIRGAFLGAGSLSLNVGYHLEFAASTDRLAGDLCALLARFGIAAKTTERKEKKIVYIKDSEAVSDCLALMGASEAVLELNSELALRLTRRQENRRTNCDIANISKTVNAAVRQTEDIRLIGEKTGLAALPDKLRAVASARLDNPEASFSYLADILNLSKSTLKNRLNKLAQIADGLRTEQENR